MNKGKEAAKQIVQELEEKNDKLLAEVKKNRFLIEELKRYYGEEIDEPTVCSTPDTIVNEPITQEAIMNLLSSNFSKWHTAAEISVALLKQGQMEESSSLKQAIRRILHDLTKRHIINKRSIQEPRQHKGRGSKPKFEYCYGSPKLPFKDK
jgi:hypothetical protein